MRRRLFITCLVMGVVIWSACGSSSSSSSPPAPPPAAESLAAYVREYNAAVAAGKAGNCAEVKRLDPRSDRFGNIGCDAETRRSFADFKVLGYRGYGSAGLIDHIGNTNPPTYRVVTATDYVALGPDKKFHWVWGDIYGHGNGIRQLGTRPTAAVAARARQTAGLYLQSLHSADCDVYYRTAFTFSLTKRVACARAFGPNSRANPAVLRRQLRADPSAQPTRIAGTRDLQVYLLRPKPNHYWTLFVSRTKGTPTQGGYVYLTVAVRAR